MQPQEFEVQIAANQHGNFANNDLVHIDEVGSNHEAYGQGLKKSLFNYMHGLCFDFPLQEWFDFKIPKTKIKHDYIINILNSVSNKEHLKNKQVVWLGASMLPIEDGGMNHERNKYIINNKTYDIIIELDESTGTWLRDTLDKASVFKSKKLTFGELAASYESRVDGNFQRFWNDKVAEELRENGLLIV